MAFHPRWTGQAIGYASTAAGLVNPGGWPSAITAVGSGLVNLATRSSSSAGNGSGMFREGADMNILSEAEAKALGLVEVGPNGELLKKRPKRRRRRLLTCSDKADIAFLHGQLGSGALGRSAISSLLSRRCS